MCSSLVTIEVGLIGEGACLVAGQQQGGCRLANRSIREIGIYLGSRGVHIDLDAGQGAAGADGRRITHCYLHIDGCGEALVVVVVNQQLVAYGGEREAKASRR